MWGLLIKPIIDTVGSIVGNYQKRKIIKAEGKIRIQEARIERTVKKLAGDIDYNAEAQKGMQASWKDEFLVVVLWGFFVACFVPALQPYIKNGLVFLKAEAPWWLEFSLLGSVVATFGLKGWKFWELKKSLITDSG